VKIGTYSKFADSEHKKTIVGAVIYSPEFCAAEETSFNDSILLLKAAKKDISFKGSLTADKNKMSGDFTYRGKVYKIDLRRGEKTAFRPQEPKEPFPYISEEVTFTNKRDSVKLAGTLTIPKKEGCYPAVILISGSAPTDRNGESNYHQSQLVLADYLTINGIAVLRYDARGVNESMGNFLTSTPENFTQDVIAGYNWLCSRKEIDSHKIGLIGHSAGGLAASIAASINPNIGFVVLLASMGIAGKDNFMMQNDLNLKTGVFTADQHSFMKDFQNRCYTMIEGGIDKKIITDTLLNFKSKYLKCFTPAGESNSQLIQFSFFTMIKIWLSSNICFLLKCNPSEYLEKVTCPVLSLNGSKDIMVPAEINQNAIREALTKGGNKDFTILQLEGLNHTFQECKTGSLKESLELEQTISPKAMSTIAEWILRHTSK
jgi:dienelactone hydrolase